MSKGSPRFRQDLAVSATDADGVACVDVSDPRTGAAFRLYDFEYQLALQLNGQPLDGVTAWAAQTFGADLTTDGIQEFAAKLGELGFLERETASAAAAAPPAKPADEGADSGVDEWMSPQGAETAQFVPDRSMLDAPELTPVAPPDLAAAIVPKTIETAVPAEATLDDDAPAAGRSTGRGDLTPPGGERALSPGEDGPKHSWAAELDGALVAVDSPSAVDKPLKVEVTLPPVPIAPAAIALPPAAPVPSAAVSAPAVAAVQPPPGVTERRQPPPPDLVEMGGFDDALPGGRRSAKPVVIVLVVLAVLAAGGYFLWSRQQAASAHQAVRVRVMAPTPIAAYRWFSGRGQVSDYQTATLAFANPGRVAELLPPGTEVAAGDVVGQLVGASGMQTLLDHDRSRVGFYRQLRDSMRAAGDAAELRQAELHLAEKQKLVEIAEAGLARYTIVATEPGEILETLAKVGASITPAMPVIRMKSRALHGAFELPANERAALASLDFCRVEVIGLGPRASNDPVRGAQHTMVGGDATGATADDSAPSDAQAGPHFVDCQRGAPTAAAAAPVGPAAAGKPGAAKTPASIEVAVTLPGDVGLVSGQPLRLAQRRYDAVFPVPSAALVTDGDRQTIWIAARDGRAEERAVTVAALDDEALVSDGLRVGDQVILDPPTDLRAGTPVVLAP